MSAPFGHDLAGAAGAAGELEAEDRGTAGGCQAMIYDGENDVERHHLDPEDDQQLLSAEAADPGLSRGWFGR